MSRSRHSLDPIVSSRFPKSKASLAGKKKSPSTEVPFRSSSNISPKDIVMTPTNKNPWHLFLGKTDGWKKIIQEKKLKNSYSSILISYQLSKR